jgi:anti-sigma regulatory factor (Ser/Thr protein kinase)
MQTRFRRELSALSAVFAMAEKFCSRNGVLKPERDALAFVLEEIFTNIVKYGGGDDEILISLLRDGDQLVASLTEHGAARFDIREAPSPDVGLPLEQRTPGGLGIHLVKKMVDRIDYDYDDGTSRITIYKRLG